MNEQELNELLKRSIPPVSELRRDLWPQMLRRLDAQAAEGSWFVALLSSRSAAPWFDWALLAALVVGVCLFPRAIPVWLYHF